MRGFVHDDLDSIFERFMRDVDALIGHDSLERAQLARTLRLALEAGPNDHAWRWLVQQTARVARRRDLAQHDRTAHQRLQAFVHENRDLDR